MTIEAGVVRSTEAVPERNLQAYCNLAGDILGIPRQSSEWDRIGRLMNPGVSQILPEAVEAALSQLPSHRADMLRRKYGLLTPRENGLSFQELTPFVGNYAPTTVRLMVRSAVKSLRIPERLDPINRVVYPERYQE